MKEIIIMGVIILLVVIKIYLYYEKNNLDVSRYNIGNKKISKKIDKYKIIQVSDFHSVKNEKLVNDIVYNIEKEKPNIIVITGDLFSNTDDKNIKASTNFLKEIKNIAPIYFVSGNHEARSNNYSKIKNILIDNNVTILDNKLKVIKYRGGEINLIGIDDPIMVNSGDIDNFDTIKKELCKVIFDKNKFDILLSHRPEFFDTYVNNNIDLILSGHTHGGQIRLPFIGAIYAPNQGLFPKYDSGLFKKEKTIMIISRGIGTSKLPIRINDRPELVIISLETR